MLHLLFLGLALLAPPQTEPLSPRAQRAEARRALREARQTPALYQETHLDLAHQPVRQGSSAPRPRVAGEPRFGRDGAPRVPPARQPGRPHRLKTEPKS